MFFALAVLFIAAILLLYKYSRNQRAANPKCLPYPPGPPPLPLIGNLLDMPTEYDWLAYSEWAKSYGMFSLYYDTISIDTYHVGDLIHMKVLDKHILVINSLEAANELFDKRSAKYSDRPDLPMLVDL